jgi:hypothetical protein
MLKVKSYPMKQKSVEADEKFKVWCGEMVTEVKKRTTVKSNLK